jgi:hypothetical protein
MGVQWEGSMHEHKFAVGESVRSAGSTVPSLYGQPMVMMPAGAYQIVRQMPALDGRAQYHVRSVGDGHVRAVVESDLSP